MLEQTSVVDPNTLNLDLHPDPGYWPHLDPDLDPGPDPGLYRYYQVWRIQDVLIRIRIHPTFQAKVDPDPKFV